MCDKFGEGGLWYLNPKLYARQMYKLREKVETKAMPDEAGTPKPPAITRMELNRIRNDEPERYSEALKTFNDQLLQRPAGGQVVPLRDAFKIAEIGAPMASMFCICRKMARAVVERDESAYSCLGTGVGMFKWERWPERYKGGVHFMPPDEVKEWLEKWDKAGFMHGIMTAAAVTTESSVYIEGICNCEYPDCGMIRDRLDYGALSMLKGHHVAMVDYDRCNGCGVCIQRCQFGAAKFEVRINKANLDVMRCYGCGLCETGCPRNAITLVDRTSLPGVKDVW